jgi:hypothetical protein
MNLESRIEKFNHVYGTKVNNSAQRMREKSHPNIRSMSAAKDEELS